MAEGRCLRTVLVNAHTARARSLTAEQEVLLLCARTCLEGEGPERLRLALDEPLDWDLLLSLTAVHHTTALLYHHLASVAPERVPAVTLANLRSHYLLLTARNLRLVGESIPLLAELEATDAPAVVWKGPALAYSVYPNPELRTFTDLDLLVRRRDVGVVRRVMKARGYLPRHRPEVTEDELFGRASEVVTMWNRETEIGVDLHWGSTRRFFSSAMDCDHLWSRGRGLSVEGTAIRALEPESMLWALCVHGAKHGPHPWPALKWVTDIEAIVRNLPPGRWGPLLSRSREMGGRRMLLLGLCLARDLLDAPLPGEVVEELARDPVVASLALSIRTRILSPRTAAFSFSERLRFDFAVRERGRDRLAYGVARLLTPSDRDLVATPPALRILRVPIRLFRLAGRYLLNPSRGKAFLLGTDDRSDPSGVTREGDR